MNDIEDPSHNTKQLRIYLGLPLCEYLEEVNDLCPPTVKPQGVPFPEIQVVTVKIICDNDKLRMELQSFPDIYLICLSNVNPGTIFSRIKGLKSKFRFDYLIHVNNNLVFTVDDFIEALETARYLPIYYYKTYTFLYFDLYKGSPSPDIMGNLSYMDVPLETHPYF